MEEITQNILKKIYKPLEGDYFLQKHIKEMLELLKEKTVVGVCKARLRRGFGG